MAEATQASRRVRALTRCVPSGVRSTPLARPSPDALSASGGPEGGAERASHCAVVKRSPMRPSGRAGVPGQRPVDRLPACDPNRWLREEAPPADVRLSHRQHGTGQGFGGGRSHRGCSNRRCKAPTGAGTALSLSAVALTVTGQAANAKPRQKPLQQPKSLDVSRMLDPDCINGGRVPDEGRVGFNERHHGHTAVRHQPFRREAMQMHQAPHTIAARRNPTRERWPNGHNTGKVHTDNH